MSQRRPTNDFLLRSMPDTGYTTAETVHRHLPTFSASVIEHGLRRLEQDGYARALPPDGTPWPRYALTGEGRRERNRYVLDRRRRNLLH